MHSFKKLCPCLLLALPMALYTQFASAQEVDGSDVVLPRIFTAQTEMVIQSDAPSKSVVAPKSAVKKTVPPKVAVAPSAKKVVAPKKVKPTPPAAQKVVKTDIEKMLDQVGLGTELTPLEPPKPVAVKVKKPTVNQAVRLPEKPAMAQKPGNAPKVVKKPQVLVKKPPVATPPTVVKPKMADASTSSEKEALLARAVDRAVKAPLQPEPESQKSVAVAPPRTPQVKPASKEAVASAVVVKKPQSPKSIKVPSNKKATQKQPKPIPTSPEPANNLALMQEKMLENAVLKASAMSLTVDFGASSDEVAQENNANQPKSVRLVPPPSQSSSVTEKKKRHNVDDVALAHYVAGVGDMRLLNEKTAQEKPQKTTKLAVKPAKQTKNIHLKPNEKKAVLAGLGTKEFKKSSKPTDLKRVLQTSLVSDPVLAEARANTAAAKSRADGSFALHYPTVSVYGNQLISENNKDNKKSERDFKPGVAAKWNLFSWGAINNQVKRDEEKERYFYYKYYESREELGFEIASEYLRAVYYHEALSALQDSLQRHQKIMADLRVIAENDKGRRSELVQAQAREVQVRQSIANYQSNLDTSLSRLAKYTGGKLKASQLGDPFAGYAIKPILALKRVDNMQHPTYMAQKAELQSVRAEMKSNRGKQFPAVNVEANANNDDKQVFLNLSWNIFDRTTSHTVDASAQELVAAESRLTQVFRDINERTRTAEHQMEQSVERINISDEQVRTTAEVAHSYELQFKIARKTLIELLNAYNDLANVELAHVNARNDFRVAALSYLHAQNQIAAWAGVPHSEEDARYEREIGLLSEEKK